MPPAGTADLRHRWSNVAPHGAPLLRLLAAAVAGASATPACLPSEVDGTWRHPAGRALTGGPAYELALGQYGPEVAGVVRLFRSVADGGDRYARQVFCTLVDEGAVTGDVLRFRFQDPDGVGFFASLTLSEDNLDGAMEQAASGDSQSRYWAVGFERVDDDVDKRCDRTEPFTLHGLVLGDAPPPPGLRVALVYTGVDPSGHRFELPRRVAALDAGAPTFAMEIAAVPDPQVFAVAPSDGSIALAYGVFIAFDDADRDLRWDRDILGDASERVLGVAPDHALVYLEGPGAAVFPGRADLLAGVNQSYSLVRVRRDEATEEVVELLPVDMASEAIRVVTPADAGRLPLLEPE